MKQPGIGWTVEGGTRNGGIPGWEPHSINNRDQGAARWLRIAGATWTPAPATDSGVRLHLITPGKPTENRYIESFTKNFNGKFRDECLNRHWFQAGPGWRRR